MNCKEILNFISCTFFHHTLTVSIMQVRKSDCADSQFPNKKTIAFPTASRRSFYKRLIIFHFLMSTVFLPVLSCRQSHSRHSLFTYPLSTPSFMAVTYSFTCGTQSAPYFSQSLTIADRRWLRRILQPFHRPAAVSRFQSLRHTEYPLQPSPALP